MSIAIARVNFALADIEAKPRFKGEKTPLLFCKRNGARAFLEVMHRDAQIA